MTRHHGRRPAAVGAATARRRGASTRATSWRPGGPCCAGSAAGAATRRCSCGTSTGSPCWWRRSCAPTARRPAALRDLAREAELLERLAHPVVVRSFGAVADGRFPHLLLEHLEGPTLDELLARDGPLALEQVLPLGAARRLRAALPRRRGRRAPRRQAEQRRDGRAAAADRPQRRADPRARRRRCARRSAPTPTWRPSSARPTDASARPPTSGGSPRRVTRRADRPQGSAPASIAAAARPRARRASSGAGPRPAIAGSPARPRAPSSRRRSSRSSPRCRAGSRSGAARNLVRRMDRRTSLAAGTLLGALVLVALHFWRGIEYWNYSEGVYAYTSRLFLDGGDLYGHIVVAQPPWQFLFGARRARDPRLADVPAPRRRRSRSSARACWRRSRSGG